MRHTRVNDIDAYAQQLALGLLDFTNWSLEWDIVDWLIPAGMFSVTDSTPVAGIQSLASAVRGFVQCDREGRLLAVRKEFPVLPWHLSVATPDIQLPAEAATVIAGDWEDLPDNNGVWVSGMKVGVEAHVVRDGTNGNRLFAPVVNMLLTEPAANQACGEAILAETGSKQSYTMVLPVYQEIGVLEPGQIIKVLDAPYPWLGYCRSSTVSVQWLNDTEGLSIMQSAKLDRHYA